MSHQTGPPAAAPQCAPRLPAPGAPACRGGWMMLTTLTAIATATATAAATATDPKLPTPLMSLTYAVQMIVGTMVVVAGAHFFAEREAARCD
ncbi:hypothetical protein OG530_10290 [Streptomyces decoyicus]|uniref:hypothetical protein n=1 Tax=Streptomyces decoyicus TaxID=249567 RepID=UPI002E178965